MMFPCKAALDHFWLAGWLVQGTGALAGEIGEIDG